MQEIGILSLVLSVRFKIVNCKRLTKEFRMFLKSLKLYDSEPDDMYDNYSVSSCCSNIKSKSKL